MALHTTLTSKIALQQRCDLRTDQKDLGEVLSYNFIDIDPGTVGLYCY